MAGFTAIDSSQARKPVKAGIECSVYGYFVVAVQAQGSGLFPVEGGVAVLAIGFEFRVLLGQGAGHQDSLSYGEILGHSQLT
jgi:hypothetical protein